MWPFNRKKNNSNAYQDAVNHLRADNWSQAKQAFLSVEQSLDSLPSPEQVTVLLGLAICHLAHGSNVEAKNALKRAEGMALVGTNAGKFVAVLHKACEKDFFADPLMVPPLGDGDFSLSNIVPVEVSFLKHSFFQLVIDAR